MDVPPDAGTNAWRRSDENQRPANTGPVSPSIQPAGGDYDHDKPAGPDAPAQIPAIELETVPTNTDPFEAFDTLLASLESDDEKETSTEHQGPTVGQERPVPSVLLETSPNQGLDDAEVLSRRKRYGWNTMKEDKRSHLKTFLMFFVGPIQCVMLVSQDSYPSSQYFINAHPLRGKRVFPLTSDS